MLADKDLCRPSGLKVISKPTASSNVSGTSAEEPIIFWHKRGENDRLYNQWYKTVTETPDVTQVRVVFAMAVFPKEMSDAPKGERKFVAQGINKGKELAGRPFFFPHERRGQKRKAEEP